MPIEIAERLRRFGIAPSMPRIAVYKYLDEMRNHPTADEVYSALLPTYPTLSRTTVYNTMKVLREHRAIQTILIENGEQRFDADTTIHGHFKCTGCGKVFDVFFSQGLPELPENFRADEVHLYYRGSCPDCNTK